MLQKKSKWTDKKFQIAMIAKHPYCMICGGVYGLVGHHLHTKGSHPELRYDENNLKILCFYCHQLIHGKNRKEMENILKTMDKI